MLSLTTMNPSDFLAYLKTQPYYRDQLAHVERMPARRAVYGQLTHALSPGLAGALAQIGATRLYSHQAQAVNAALQGRHVIVATGTASGKTLCYNIPVLEAILSDPQSRALYLFPTKALAYDQLRALTALTAPISPRPAIGAYDGDTPAETRLALRAEASILLTNPDMLHLGILPHHSLWADFLAHLRYVVLDEAHAYRGVFGSHVALVLRRLNRLCEHYGSRPQYIACSATIANPGEHAARLTGVEPVVVDTDGSPGQARYFALWNPPFADEQMTARRSPYGEAAALFAALVSAGVRNITFTKARVVAELILTYARAMLKRANAPGAERMASYRAGYLAEHRREIEAALSSGELIGVTATNALELGVDIGGLEAVVSVGYPGTVAALWQQMGRAGRRGYQPRHSAALAILIGQDNPLDQYFMRHPAELFARPHEHALIDPDNPYILQPHLLCAALELPLTPQDEARFGAGFVPAMIALENDRQLVYQPGADNWMYMGDNYPARRVNIRSLGRKPVTLLDVTETERPLETMDAGMAPARVHQGAIYIHQGDVYRVKSLDLAAGEARLVATNADYFTRARELNQLQIDQLLRRQALKRVMAYWGAVTVTQHVQGYRQIRHLTESRGKEIPLDLPPHSFKTRALWWELPKPWAQAVHRRGWHFAGGLYAIQYAAMGILPLFAMCDAGDIGGHVLVAHPETGAAQIFIYDAFSGGVGISEQGFLQITELWRSTLAAIKACPCHSGCPSCIYSAVAEANKKPDKNAAIWILEAMLQ